MLTIKLLLFYLYASFLNIQYSNSTRLMFYSDTLYVVQLYLSVVAF